MDEIIKIQLDTEGNVDIKIPSSLVIGIFEDYNEGQLKLTPKSKMAFMGDFAQSFREKIEDDDFMNEVMGKFIYDADYIKEVEDR
jgi:hypothetical protein